MVMPEATETGPSDEGTLEGLFARHEEALLRYAARLVQDFEVAQEIVQESFMKLHAQFDQVRQPRPWLYRTVHNMALNHLRGGRNIVPLQFEDEAGEALEPVDGQPLPAEVLSRRETIDQTRRCVASLKDRDRELIALKFEEGLSYKEISQRTGLSVSNVGFILHHALKRLAAALEDLGVEL